ncbi:hypothetical protein KR009_008797 [Drosophila setifemur]|nr:hypothetical protein KR009_008797 [Drosophila setifemur]
MALGWLCFLSCLCQAPTPTQAESDTPKTRYNVSFAQLDTCESYSVKNTGYAYRDFFMVHSLDNNKLRNGERLHLKFYVLTTMDAHILLSVTNHLRPNDRVYEIVIGAGGNTFSAIRTTMGMRRVATNQDRNLLSLYEPTPIEIVQTQDAELFVYIPGFKKEPLLKFVDTSALAINYISFSSFNGNTARWFYDCGFDGFEKEMEAEVAEPTKRYKLLAHLRLNGNNASLPANLSSLQFHFQTRSLAYDPTSAVFRARMHLILHWQDTRLSWNPADFGNMESVEHWNLNIWEPQLSVLNGALDSMGNVLHNYAVRVYANGNVTLYSENLQLSSWCVDTARNWPNERVTCSIELGLIGQLWQQSIALIYDQSRRPIAPNEHVNTPSGWTFNDISVVQVANGSQMRYTPKDMLQTMTGDVSIEFSLHRNNSFYMTVFFLPLIASQIFLILSFVLQSTRRSALILIALLITAWGLMYMTRYASPHYVPAIMSAYKIVMITSTYCYILHICMIWLGTYPPRAKAPKFLEALINCNALRCILGLRLADVSYILDYYIKEKLIYDMRMFQSSDFCEVQEKPWPQLAKMLNNLSSIVVIVTFAIVNVSTGI